MRRCSAWRGSWRATIAATLPVYPLPSNSPAVNSASISQSVAINYFIAQGASPAEAALILAVEEHVKELRERYSSLVPYGTKPSAAALDAFFNSAEASDATGPADSSKRRRGGGGHSARRCRAQHGRRQSARARAGRAARGSERRGHVAARARAARGGGPGGAPGCIGQGSTARRMAWPRRRRTAPLRS